ncbi:MAG: TonB-dependent receptor [Proteobacteria bacterium]|nr:TonB-dependent receptor [Pseudomonadota bacterium]HQR04848.1 TonB-dependent receptor [Rhodocyclaceae bacterium]
MSGAGLRWVLCAAGIVGLLACAPPAHAQAGAAVEFDLPGQSLAAALRHIAEWQKLQIVFAPQDVEGLITPRLHGRFTALEAVRRLAEAAGLGYADNGSDTVVLRRRDDGPAQHHGGSRPENPTRLAPAQPPGSSADASNGNPRGKTEHYRAHPDSDPEEIVVTGSYLRQSSPADIVVPLSILSGTALAAQGTVSPADLVKNLNLNAAAQFQVDSLGQNLTSGTASINLRGLGLGSTLVMINGRRHTLSAVATGDGASFVDLNSLMPMIMVERVEILKDGAAATYGSDAVAGVVNVVPRDHFEGAWLQAGYGQVAASPARDRDFSALWGGHDGPLRWVLAFGSLDRTPLRTPNRPWSLAATYGYPAWAGVSTFGRPGSYLAPGQGQHPDSACGQVPGSFLRGTTCMLDYSPYFDLSPKETRQQTYTVLSRTQRDLKATLEFGYTRSQTTTIASPSFPILTTVPIIPASHPDNPYGQPLLWLGRVLGAPDGPSVTRFRYDTLRLVATLSGALRDGWMWDFDSAYSQQNARYDRPDILKSRLALALNGLGGAGCDPATGTAGHGACRYFNPFGTSYTGTGTPNPPALLAWLTGGTGLHAGSSLLSSNLVFSGDLLTLPAGPVTVALGLHHRYERMHHAWSAAFNANDLATLGGGSNFDASRAVWGLFGEARMPLRANLEARFSVRHENYGGGMRSFDPKLALLWRPAPGLSLRGSASTAFRAPSLLQAKGVQSSNPFVSDTLTGTTLYANVQTRGSDRLKPEAANIFSLGATWAPSPRTELGLDYWRFEYHDLIVKENAQQLVDSGAPGIVRDPASRSITLIQANFVNASAVNTAGLDWDLRHRIPVAGGMLGLGLQWTRTLRYELRTQADATQIDGLGSLNATNFAGPIPRDRGTLSTNWTEDNHQFSVYWRHVGAYRNDRPGAFITQRRIGAWNTLDAQYRQDFHDILPGGGVTTLTVGGTNLTDHPPPFAQLLLAYDPRTIDPRGRVLYLSLRHALP